MLFRMWCPKRLCAVTACVVRSGWRLRGGLHHAVFTGLDPTALVARRTSNEPHIFTEFVFKYRFILANGTVCQTPPACRRCRGSTDLS
jgi:hypothetical protein